MNAFGDIIKKEASDAITDIKRNIEEIKDGIKKPNGNNN